MKKKIKKILSFSSPHYCEIDLQLLFTCTKWFRRGLSTYVEKELNHAYFSSQTRLFSAFKGGKDKIHQINTFHIFPPDFFFHIRSSSIVGVFVNTLHSGEFSKIYQSMLSSSSFNILDLRKHLFNFNTYYDTEIQITKQWHQIYRPHRNVK